jgi:hypothetical protein
LIKLNRVYIINLTEQVKKNTEQDVHHINRL